MNATSAPVAHPDAPILVAWNAYLALHRAMDAMPSPVPDNDPVYDDLLSASVSIGKTLRKMPAATLAGLRWKLRTIMAEDNPDAETHRAALFDDDIDIERATASYQKYHPGFLPVLSLLGDVQRMMKSAEPQAAQVTHKWPGVNYFHVRVDNRTFVVEVAEDDICSVSIHPTVDPNSIPWLKKIITGASERDITDAMAAIAAVCRAMAITDALKASMAAYAQAVKSGTVTSADVPTAGTATGPNQPWERFTAMPDPLAEIPSNPEVDAARQVLLRVMVADGSGDRVTRACRAVKGIAGDIVQAGMATVAMEAMEAAVAKRQQAAGRADQP